MKKLISLIFICIVTVSTAQVDKYLRKGSKALENNKLEKARINYQKAYDLDKTAYATNASMGYLLAEYFFKYEEALPYLEIAYNKTPIDTVADLLGALAKCYQYVGEFKKAYALYDNLIVRATMDKEQDHAYIIDLKKRR